MRSFIAIELPEAIQELLSELSARLRESGANASWVRPGNIHLTLRFLGEVDEDGLDRLAEVLSERYTSVSPFPLSVRGIGAFPNLRRPSVIWAGVGPVEGALTEVQAAAEAAAQAIGLPEESKSFHPHLTLARLRLPRGIEPLLARLQDEKDFSGGDFIANAVSLFSSELTPRGSIYRRLKEFRF